jgi:GDPmannose 4,6-dehydratase
MPDEIYNLAAQSDVRASFDVPCYTAMVDSIGVLSMLEAVRTVGLKTKIYQASTSELYSGDPAQAPQNEATPFKPRSPYGVAKLYGFEIARIYRESYNMHVSNGILFNHESPRRGFTFLTRKVTVGIAEILAGRIEHLTVGNLDAKRDWGYAKEYMEAVWKIMQQKKPKDYVLATGETHSVREFIEEAFLAVGITIVWKGKGVHEKGYNKLTKDMLVDINPNYFRPNEVDHLCGDASLAHRELKWKPKTSFKDLVKMMVEYDVNKITYGK